MFAPYERGNQRGQRRYLRLESEARGVSVMSGSHSSSGSQKMSSLRAPLLL